MRNFAVGLLQISLRGDRNAELLETSRSNCTLMNTVNELCIYFHFECQLQYGKSNTTCIKNVE